MSLVAVIFPTILAVSFNNISSFILFEPIVPVDVDEAYVVNTLSGNLFPFKVQNLTPVLLVNPSTLINMLLPVCGFCPIHIPTASGFYS